MLVSLVGCRGELSEADKAFFTDSIDDYYENESRGNWQALYSCRDKQYKELVPFHVFKEQMQEDRQDWETESIDVQAIRRDGGEVIATIQFVESYNSVDVIRQHGAPANFSFLEETRWSKDEGRLVCLMPGFRGHLSMNRLPNY